MILHIGIHVRATAIGRCIGVFVAVQLSSHLRPRVQFEHLAYGQRGLDDSRHRIHHFYVHIVLILKGHRQVVVVVTQIDGVRNGVFAFCAERCDRRSYTCRLGWRVVLVTIVFRRIVEHGVTSHRHEFLTARAVIYRVADDTIREVVFTNITREHTPQGIRYIRVAYIPYALAIPTPPSVEGSLANR